MFAPERQQAILDLARQQGRVDVPGLATCFDVTAETIRRDLTTLERRRLLRRTHGGAVPIERLDFERLDFELGLADREALLVEEKRRIAMAALAELPDEGTVLLDAGTTTAALARLIPADRELTIVTNGLMVAVALLAQPDVTVHVLGGRVRGRTMAVVDDWAKRCLSEVFVEVAFVGANGVSVAHGLTTPDLAEAAVKAALISAARRTVVLADHTKFQTDHFARFGRLAEVDVLITDTGVEADLAAEVERAGPKVVLA
jgi:DeoR family fructose operon transcriptional repressor